MTLKEVLATVSVKRYIDISQYDKNAEGHVKTIWSGLRGNVSLDDLKGIDSREVCALIPYIERSENGREDDKPVLMIYLLDKRL